MIKKIGIGTAQWGSAYGISNRNGKVINKEISNILSIAQSRGVKIIDTAPTYGNAEKSLSEQNLHAFNIVTKIPKFSKSEITVNDIIKLNSRIEHFLSLLGASQIYGILVHDGSDIMAKGGEYICDTLCDLKERGLVKKIGVSIYDSKNLDNICTRLKPDIIQLPINIFDNTCKSFALQYLEPTKYRFPFSFSELYSVELSGISINAFISLPWMGRACVL